MPDFRIWNGHFPVFEIGSFFIFEIATFFVFEDGTFRFLKLPISFLIIRRLRDKVIWEMSTFEIIKFEMSSSEGKDKQRKIKVKVLKFPGFKFSNLRWQSNMANINIRNASIRSTVEPLYSGHHWDLKKMSSIERCPPHRGFAQIGTFTSNTAPKCIRTAQPYSPIGLPLLKLVKSMDQRHCVITTLYI